MSDETKQNANITNQAVGGYIEPSPNCPHCHGSGFVMLTHDFQNNGHPYGKPMGCGCTLPGQTVTTSAQMDAPAPPSAAPVPLSAERVEALIASRERGEWLKETYAETANALRELVRLRQREAEARALLMAVNAESEHTPYLTQTQSMVRAFLADGRG